MQFLIKKHQASVREEKKRGVEFPAHNDVRAAMARHPAMLWENQMDGCLPCQNGIAHHPQTLVLATVPTQLYGSGLRSGPVPNRGNGFHHTRNRTIAIGPVLPAKTRHFKFTTLAPIQYLSSDCIMTWSLRRLCLSTRCSTSCCQI